MGIREPGFRMDESRRDLLQTTGNEARYDPYHDNRDQDPAPPIVHAHAGTPPLHGAVGYPHSQPTLPHVPIPGKNMSMHAGPSQSSGEGQRVAIREPGFRMDVPHRASAPLQTTGSEARYDSYHDNSNQDREKGPPDAVPIAGNTGRRRPKKDKTQPAPTARCGICLASIAVDVYQHFNGFCSDLHMWNAIHNQMAPLCQRCRGWACYVGNALCGGSACKN